MIAVLTYNTFPAEIFPYKNGLIVVEDVRVLMLMGIFTQAGEKSPAYVSEADPQFGKLLSYRSEVTKVIVFIGKESSGSFAIADLLLKYFKDTLSKLFFVMCKHVPVEKRQEFVRRGILQQNIVYFSDGKDVCAEAPLLEGYLLHEVRKYRST